MENVKLSTILLFINFTFSEVSTAKMSKRGRGGAAGAKFRISLACPVGAVMNCADHTIPYSVHNGVVLVAGVL